MRLKAEENDQQIADLTKHNLETNKRIYDLEKDISTYKNKLSILLGSIENYQYLILLPFNNDGIEQVDGPEETFAQKLYLIYNEIYEIQSLEKIILQNVEEQDANHEQTEELHHLRDQVHISLLYANDYKDNSNEASRSIALIMDEVNNWSEENEIIQYETAFHVEDVTATGNEELVQLELAVDKQIKEVDKCIQYLQSN